MSAAARGAATVAKYSGAGNDFLIIDERFEPSLQDGSTEAKALCRRGVSIGADGLVRISFKDLDESSGAVARMRLWNADGSAAAFSGNAARCAVRYLADEGLASDAVCLQTDIGLVTGHVQGRTVRVAVPGVAKVYGQSRIRVEGRDLLGTYVRVGIPFFVLLHDNPDELPVRYLGRSIRTHAALQPEGANVDFARVDDEQSLYFRVYERGVENETLSSGTGSIAAALAAAAADRVASPVACTAKGGTLTVRFRRLSATETTASGTETEAQPVARDEPDNTNAPAEPATTPSPQVAVGEPIVFDQIEVEGDTRRLLTGTAHPDSLRLR